MATINLCFSDTPEGGVKIVSDYAPTIGAPCSPAQQAALETVNRTKKQWGVATAPRPLPVSGIDIDAIHRSRDNVVASA